VNGPAQGQRRLGAAGLVVGGRFVGRRLPPHLVGPHGPAPGRRLASILARPEGRAPSRTHPRSGSLSRRRSPVSTVPTGRGRPVGARAVERRLPPLLLSRHGRNGRGRTTTEGAARRRALPRRWPAPGPTAQDLPFLSFHRVHFVSRGGGGGEMKRIRPPARPGAGAGPARADTAQQIQGACSLPGQSRPLAPTGERFLQPSRRRAGRCGKGQAGPLALRRPENKRGPRRRGPPWGSPHVTGTRAGPSAARWRSAA
jgi:hypothetical protein